MAPSYVYKIFDEPPPSPLPETLPSTALDAQDGFIHLSTALQTPLTAKHFFGRCTTLWIAKLAVDALDGHIGRSTDPDSGINNGCPHLHGSGRRLGSGNIVGVVELQRPAEDDWTSVKALQSLED